MTTQDDKANSVKKVSFKRNKGQHEILISQYMNLILLISIKLMVVNYTSAKLQRVKVYKNKVFSIL